VCTIQVTYILDALIKYVALYHNVYSGKLEIRLSVLYTKQEIPNIDIQSESCLCVQNDKATDFSLLASVNIICDTFVYSLPVCI